MGTVTRLNPPGPPPPAREPRVRVWGVNWSRRRGPTLIATAADQRFDLEPQGGDLWARVHFIAAMNGRPSDFCVSFRQAVPEQYLNHAND